MSSLVLTLLSDRKVLDNEKRQEKSPPPPPHPARSSLPDAPSGPIHTAARAWRRQSWSETPLSVWRSGPLVHPPPVSGRGGSGAGEGPQHLPAPGAGGGAAGTSSS